MIMPMIATSQKDPRQVEISLVVYSLFLAFLLVVSMLLLTIKNSFPGIIWPITYVIFVGVIWAIGTQIAEISNGKRVILMSRKRLKVDVIGSLLIAAAIVACVLILGG